MKRTLRILALVLALGALALWLATGASCGWTKTSVPVKQLDPVTGIEGINYVQRFVPGLDFLGGSLLAAAAMAGLSLFLGTRTKQSAKTSLLL